VNIKERAKEVSDEIGFINERRTIYYPAKYHPGIISIFHVFTEFVS